MKELSKRMERLEKQMLPTPPPPRWTTVHYHDGQPSETEAEREALARARGDNVWIWDFITPRHGPDGSVIPHGTDSDRAAKTAG